MNEEEKESIEEFRKQLRLEINIDDVTTDIRNDNAQTILNLIEKLQKENEELKNIELKSKGGAIKVSLEGVLSLENKIKQLEKENEELKFKERSRIIGEYGDTEIHDVINKILSNDYISVQKVKDKIEEYKNMLKTYNKAKDIDRIKAINERILELEELLEGKK